MCTCARTVVRTEKGALFFYAIEGGPRRSGSATDTPGVPVASRPQTMAVDSTSAGMYVSGVLPLSKLRLLISPMVSNWAEVWEWCDEGS